MFGRQDHVLAWAVSIFGPVAETKRERARRFLEEAIELAHALELPESDALKLLARVYARPPGDQSRELAQAGMTLECLASATGWHLDNLIASEFERCLRLPPEHHRERHAAKVAAGISE